jgi:hypothetical protein
MEKTRRNKLKDKRRTEESKWINIPTTINRRTTGSGVTFSGCYVLKKSGD